MPHDADGSASPAAAAASTTLAHRATRAEPQDSTRARGGESARRADADRAGQSLGRAVAARDGRRPAGRPAPAPAPWRSAALSAEQAAGRAHAAHAATGQSEAAEPGPHTTIMPSPPPVGPRARRRDRLPGTRAARRDAGEEPAHVLPPPGMPWPLKPAVPADAASTASGSRLSIARRRAPSMRPDPRRRPSGSWRPPSPAAQRARPRRTQPPCAWRRRRRRGRRAERGRARPRQPRRRP